MRGVGCSLVCAVALAANCTGEPVSLGTLLDGLTDRTALTYYPERDYRIRNWSSYDRKSVSPDAAGWFANDDVNQFIRTEGVEQVMVDAKGPGAIVRLWVTGAAMSNGVIRIYLDGSPAFEGEAWALCGGTALCGEPLSFFTTPPRRNPAQCGRNLILPIPYARSCKVTFEPRLKGCKLWYNVETRSYADGVPVETLTGKGFASAAEKVGAAAAALSDFSRIAPDARTGASLDGVIPPGGSLVREIRAGEDGARAIHRLALRVDDAASGSLAVTAALDRVSVELDFDGVAKSAMPLGAFFGTGPWELTPYRTRFTEVTSAGTMENRLVMPFRSSATIRLVNASDRPVRIVDSALAEGPYAWVEGRSMRLAATYVRRRGISSSKGGRPYDLTFDETNGKGVLVGTMVFVGNALNRPKASWWGEGDEKVWVDGETFPSVFGTGTEDYFNYAWCRPEAFSQAFCAQPSGTGNLAPGRSANIRWRQLDAIPFAKSLRFDMEMWHWDRAVMLDYDSVSWRYMLEERPAYGWRGLLLDSSRHFFTVPEIRKTLDTMAAQGLNVLHWHLVDGAGWRLQIDRYPLLTEKGAVRSSNFGAKRTYLYMHDASASPDGKYGPFFYTKDDVRGIVAYAAKRGIRVVPEIEIPGHEDAAIRCYPFLRCPRGGCEICIGSDEAIGFFENVLDEVVELFPDEVVHIGGDECNTDAWKSCPKCQARLKAIGKTDVRALQHWVTAHFAEYLAKKGRRIMGWGDIYGGEGLPKTAIVQVWDKPEVAARATRDGYDIVYSVSGTSYLDYAQRLVGDTYEYPSFAGWMTCETVYRYFNPSAGVAAADRGHVLGGEGCAWTENIADQRELEWKCWPRLAIIADLLRTGTPVGRRDWAAYRPKLERVREDLVTSGVNAAPLGPLESGKLSALPADCTATAWNGSTCPVFGPKVTRETKNLVFKRDAAVPAGGFRIRMSWREVRIYASDAAGEDRALEVLNQIAVPREGGRVLFIPNVEIDLRNRPADAPKVPPMPYSSLPEPTCTETVSVPGEAPSLLPAGRKFRLVWNDEFLGTRLDEGKWGYRVNFWDLEDMWFARPDENAVEVSDGTVKLKLIRRADGSFASPQLQTGSLSYECHRAKRKPEDEGKRRGVWPFGRISKPKFAHKYGYWECRCKLQQNPGWWSAFWIQAPAIGMTTDARQSGVECDVMESFSPGTVVSHMLHYAGYGSQHERMCAYPGRRNGVIQMDKTVFHTFGVLWERDGYTFYIDGRQSGEKVTKMVSDTEQFILISTECQSYRTNGTWAKALEKSLPDCFEVDYVRVYDEVR